MTTQSPEVSDLMTIPEAARALHINYKTALREVEAGGLEGRFRIGPQGGRIIRVTRASVDAYYTPIIPAA